MGWEGSVCSDSESQTSIDTDSTVLRCDLTLLRPLNHCRATVLDILGHDTAADGGLACSMLLRELSLEKR